MMLSLITEVLFDWLKACFIVCQLFGVFFQVLAAPFLSFLIHMY
jgi:hypothetical protein